MLSPLAAAAETSSWRRRADTSRRLLCWDVQVRSGSLAFVFRPPSSPSPASRLKTHPVHQILRLKNCVEGATRVPHADLRVLDLVRKYKLGQPPSDADANAKLFTPGFIFMFFLEIILKMWKLLSQMDGFLFPVQICWRYFTVKLRQDFV